MLTLCSVIDETDVKHCSVTSPCCCYLPVSLSAFCQPPSSLLSLIYTCIVHHQSGVWDSCLECLCCILLLIHFPLKHFLFPSQIYSLTCTHKLLLTRKTCATIVHTHTHTRPADLSHWFKPPTHAWMCLCVGLCAYALVLSWLLHLENVIFSLSPPSYPLHFQPILYD